MGQIEHAWRGDGTFSGCMGSLEQDTWEGHGILGSLRGIGKVREAPAQPGPLPCPLWG